MAYRITPDRRTLGVTFSADDQANVLVWAPLVDQVAIKVYGQPDVLPLDQQAMGYWALTTDRIRPGDQYRFMLNGQYERPDPASLYQPQGVHGPSEAVDTARFPWTDQDWRNPDLADYLLYEVHTGTATTDGTFLALEETLDHLNALGVNALEIMPISQFPDGRNWGYDGVFAFAAENAYGGPAALQHLVDACHRKGIAVVLDVVYNHLGPEGNYLPEFGPYLTDKYRTPWGDAINVDDAWCDGVRQFIIENALMWLRDFHIDALRLDAVHAIKDFSPLHVLEELRQQVDQLIETTGRRYHLIVENDLNDPRFINPPGTGYGMNAQWMDEFHHALHVCAGQEKTGYYADFNGVAHLAKSYRDAYVYDGQFSATRQKRFGRRAETNPGHQFIVFSQNHDQIGNREQGERSSALYSFAMQKLLAGAVFVSPYVPLLFMGEEWGETAPFQYFVSHTEPSLVETVRQGREDEFSDFRGNGVVPDPQTEETFQRSKLQWALREQEPHQTMLAYYQALISLRKNHPVLRQLDRQNLRADAYADQQTLVLHRWQADQAVVCLLNFSQEPQSIPTPVTGKQWQKRFDSTDPQWTVSAATDSVVSPDTLPVTGQLTIPPESLCIYARTDE